MDNEKFSKLMYFLTKHAATFVDFADFLDIIGVSQNEYERIKKHLKETYGVKTYV